jgi:hypothetical protein
MPCGAANRDGVALTLESLANETYQSEAPREHRRRALNGAITSTGADPAVILRAAWVVSPGAGFVYGALIGPMVTIGLMVTVTL